MAASEPHVAVVVDYSNETAQFLARLGFVDSEESLYLLLERLNAFAGYPLPEVLKFTSSKEGFLGVGFESCSLQS